MSVLAYLRARWHLWCARDAWNSYDAFADLALAARDRSE